MRLDSVGLFEVLETCERVLIAGAGGGFDVFSGLPLYLRLLENGHQVWLANYSFSDLDASPRQPMIAVDSDSPASPYFPEKYLCEWLDANIEHCSLVYAFTRTGVRPLSDCYQQLVDELELDAILLVDGGTDSLLRGDEEGIGTPTEDATSLAALMDVEVEHKLLVCLGFGVDTFHGVSHHYFLEAVAALTKSGHFLGSFSLLPTMEEAEMTREALEYCHQQMPEHPSIVTSSVLSACSGEFGDYHSVSRTAGSELYINPLMSLYWAFHLEGVVERCLYLDKIRQTQTIAEVGQAIVDFRKTQKLRPWHPLPV